MHCVTMFCCSCVYVVHVYVYIYIYLERGRECTGQWIKISQPALVNVDSLCNEVLSSFSATACLGARQYIAACSFS